MGWKLNFHEFSSSKKNTFKLWNPTVCGNGSFQRNAQISHCNISAIPFFEIRTSNWVSEEHGLYQQFTLDPNGLFGYFHLAPALDFEVFAELNRGESAISPSPQTTVSWGKSRIQRWIFFSNISGQTQVFVWRVSLPEVLFPMSTTVMHVARQDARSDVAYSNGHRSGGFQPLVQT
jgi:hypothetical protein